MYVTLHPMVIHSCAKYGMTMSKDKNMKPCQKPYKYDLDAKDQHPIGIINVL